MAVIGFIGLGHMGAPMALNLLHAGHQLQVLDKVPAAMAMLTEQGAKAAASLADVIKDADVVITMLQTGEQVQGVCLSDEGLFAHADQRPLFIDCSSIAVQASRALHQQAQDKNLAMIDAPVSGGVKGAQAGSLTIMVGGSDDNFKRAQPILAVLGKKIIHAGQAGNGQVAKICNNMILGVSMIATCEAFNLGEKLGLDAKTFFEISSQASGQCWSMTSYCPAPGVMDNVPSNNDYQAGFTAAMMLKDLNLSQDAAQSVDAMTELGRLATELYQQFVTQAGAELDFSGIMRFIKK